MSSNDKLFFVVGALAGWLVIKLLNLSTAEFITSVVVTYFLLWIVDVKIFREKVK